MFLECFCSRNVFGKCFYNVYQKPLGRAALTVSEFKPKIFLIFNRSYHSLKILKAATLWHCTCIQILNHYYWFTNSLIYIYNPTVHHTCHVIRFSQSWLARWCTLCIVTSPDDVSPFLSGEMHGISVHFMYKLLISFRGTIEKRYMYRS